MRRKKVSISIGIPAYNEEANIKKLLLSILSQNSKNFTLKEIIVISDYSTDNTEREVKSVKDQRIKLINNKKRVGLAGGQNKIIKLFKGEILVLLNADVLPANNSFLDNLIKPFYENTNVALVGPKITPLKANTFFETIINNSVEFKDSMAEKWRKGNNLYLCRGAGRAFNREFAKKIYWKDSLSEDAYSYLLCIKNEYKFVYERYAKLYYKSPDNFGDHKKQSARFVSGPEVMSKYFSKELVKREYTIPKNIIIQSMLEYFWKNPFLFSFYLLTLLIIRISSRKGDFAKSIWKPSVSSKTLKI